MRAYGGPIFDVDVHHRLRADADVADYLDAEWREHVVRAGKGFRVQPPLLDGVVRIAGPGRDDAVPAGGGKAGSDYATLRDQLLDPSADYRVVLTHQLGEFGCHPNQYFARALCRAMNDWTIEQWLPLDERLHAVVVVPQAEPEEAAREIRRVGGHPRLVGVLFSGNVLGRPIGDPLFHPIFDAAAEVGLAVVAHLSTTARPHPGAIAAGGRLTFLTAVSQGSQQAMHYISSLLVHGVFEQWPGLRLLLAEYGIGWLPYAMWRLDQTYPLLKLESPWVKRLPSEVIREHVRVSTQPLEEDFGDRSGLFDLLSCIDGVERLLCFSSDYPHWTMDEPDYVARRLPEAWRPLVMNDNACELFDLPVRAAV